MRQKQRKIEIGEIYGSLKVIGIFQDKPRKYTVQCLRCGKTYTTSGQNLLKYSSGCPDCRARDTIVDRYKPYTGKRFGYLEVLGFAGQGVRGAALARCLCHKCGREIVTTYSRLLYSGIKTCAQCAKENLYAGLDIHKKLITGGTDVAAIHNRKTNSNSTTGHKGVSKMKSGRYRAYIYFRRHQYHLGSYDEIEDAIEARKEAEKKVFGGFLEWYKASHPDEWKRYIGSRDK
ncbi:hypothetical protein SAMN02745687_00906 [Lachnospiraceae bacterium NK3A20]|nr:hypothetical protein SAMN02745687_00906 [Lachnospiraceae bacterium NK3A20]